MHEHGSDAMRVVCHASSVMLVTAISCEVNSTHPHPRLVPRIKHNSERRREDDPKERVVFFSYQ